MSDFTARITETLLQHRGWLSNEGVGAYCLCNEDFRADTSGGSLRLHADHVATLIAEAAEQHYRPRVEVATTVEELDTLPIGTILADLHCDLTPPPVYVRFIDGWSLDGLKVKPGRQGLTVLWSPGADE